MISTAGGALASLNLVRQLGAMRGNPAQRASSGITHDPWAQSRTR